MQYLPIYPEKNWDQTVLGYDYWGPAGESLPVTNTFLDAARGFSQFARQANNPIERGEDVIYGLGNLGGSVIVGPIVDAVGNIGNTAYNGYKRLYNYGANAYNNVADRYNNWQMQRNNPQTSLTGRKIGQITTNTAARMQALSPQGDEAEVYTFNPVLEKANEEKLNAFRKPQVNSSPAILNTTQGIGGTISAATQQQKNDIKKSEIVNALSSMAKAGLIETNIGTVKKLIDLYNKVK